MLTVTKTVHSPTVKDIKTRGTVGNTVVRMHPVSDNGILNVADIGDQL